MIRFLIALTPQRLGKRYVSACFGFVIDFHDTIEHPVGWRFAGLRGVALDVGDGMAKERELSVAWALWQDDEPRVQLGVRAESQEVGVVVRDEHELLADRECQQLIVSHAELPSVARGGCLVPVGVRVADQHRRQALIDPELHAPRAVRRLGTGRLAAASQGRTGRPRRGLACAHSTATGYASSGTCG